MDRGLMSIQKEVFNVRLFVVRVVKSGHHVVIYVSVLVRAWISTSLIDLLRTVSGIN